MPNAKDITVDAPAKVLFIGKSGTRKSTVGSSFPGPIFHMDFDGRIGALRGMDIDYEQYPRSAGWGRAEKRFEKLKDQAKSGQQKYRTIHLASITSLLDFWLDEAKAHYEATTQGGLRIMRKGGAKPLLMSDMPHYKHVHACLDELLYDYIFPLGMVYNIVIEAHEQTRFDKDGDPVGDQLLATPSLAERIPSVFDETWQFKFKKDPDPKKGGHYFIWFRNNHLAKTAFHELPDVIEITDKEKNFYQEVFLPIVRKENV